MPAATHRAAPHRRRACAVSLALAASLSSACDAHDVEVEAPTGKVEAQLEFLTDGSIALEAMVHVQMYGTDRAETYTLGDVTLTDPTVGAAWVVDSVETEDGTWPVTVQGDLAYETRRVRVRAHSAPFEFILEPTISVDVRHGGEVMPAALVSTYTASYAPCELPNMAPFPAPIGGTLTWSADVLPFVVSDVLELAADPLGRTFVATGFTTTDFQNGIRVVGASASGVESVLELRGQDVAIAPGRGWGPTIVTMQPAPDGTWTESVTRRNTDLDPVWTRAVQRVVWEGPLVAAASGGHVLLAAHPLDTLTIDGVTIAGVSQAPQLLLLDEGTGEFLHAAEEPRVRYSVGLGKGAFAIATESGAGVPPALVRLEPDLTERWRVNLLENALDLAAMPDGSVWVSHGYKVDQYDADGALVRSVGVPLHSSFAPLADGSVLVGDDTSVTRAGVGIPATTAAMPSSAVQWCAASARFRVASGATGPVFAASPFVNSPFGPTFNGVTILGALAL